MTDSDTSRKLLIVVADDERVTRTILRAALTTRFGVGRILEARTGEEAIERCAEASPDVILMDVDMPDMDGVTATRRVLARHPYVNVVAYSAHASPEVRDRMLEAGAVAFVHKDEPFERLVEVLNAFRTSRT